MGKVYEMVRPGPNFQTTIKFDVPTSILWYRALEKDSEAQNCLGTALLHGVEIGQNFEAAYFWFKSACNLGCLNAMSNLAYMYVEGIYVQQNFNFARILVEEAASRGCPHAENNLGLIIGFGLTEEPDQTLAKVSFAIAARKGVRAAEKNLELIA